MTNNAYEDILLPDVDLFNIDSVKAFNEARQKRISAGDKNPPPEAIFRERLQTPPPKHRQAKDHEILAGFLSATPNTRKRALNDLIKKQKADGLWEEEGDKSITVSEDESDKEVQRQLRDSDKDQDASLIPSSRKLLTASDLQEYNPSKHGGLIIPSVMQNPSGGVVYRYLYDHSLMKAMISPLGIPWHATKGSPFANSFSYHGFEWDIPSKTVFISSEKCAKLLSKIAPFRICSASHTKNEVLSLLGSLYHATFVYREGRAYINNVIAWIRHFPSSSHQEAFIRHHAPPSLITDPTWWSDILQEDSFFRSIALRPPTQDMDIWVDASTSWGIGILIGGRWDAWRLNRDVLQAGSGKDIAWLEALAVEFMVGVLVAQGHRSMDILIRSDNQGVIVPREQCFNSWTSPFAIRRTEAQSARGISEDDTKKLFDVMLHSVDINTRKTYSTGLTRFHKFCDKRGISEDLRMPASEELLSLFISSHAGAVSDSTVNNWLAGLHFWHTINSAPWHGDGSGLLSRTYTRVRKMVPISLRRAKHPLVTIEHMQTLHSGLNHSDPFDIAVWATAAVAFWSCCHLGELVIPSASGFDQNKHVTHNAKLTFGFTNSSKDSQGTEFATLPIPWSKTTGNEGASISITARPGNPLCPLLAIRRHISLNFSRPPNIPLFSFNSSSKEGWSLMTKDLFLRWCNKIWTAAGMPEMPGHSFRIGGATHLLLMGVHPDIVATQGRWLLRAFLEYWRRIDSILPLFISSHQSFASHLSIQLSMKTYAKRHGLPASV
ncbi:hypothetical protein EST38_g13003 [Candolleomyces aberdarensis]|uniref:Uncharacterized protein n=1 Tax=Candolleomyces aberdarensis TaxID=2316362 RepID=A0A4Q2D3C1_9AGAR|nr:hypothetical protein EST38_g13003 [Candolleomyces aberdarensis]